MADRIWMISIRSVSDAGVPHEGVFFIEGPTLTRAVDCLIEQVGELLRIYSCTEIDDLDEEEAGPDVRTLDDAPVIEQ